MLVGMIDNVQLLQVGEEERVLVVDESLKLNVGDGLCSEWCC